MINNIPLQLTSGSSAEIFSNHATGSAVQGIMIKNTTNAISELKIELVEQANNIDFEIFSSTIDANDTLFVKHPLYLNSTNTLRVTAVTGDMNILFSYLVDKGVSMS